MSSKCGFIFITFIMFPHEMTEEVHEADDSSVTQHCQNLGRITSACKSDRTCGTNSFSPPEFQDTMPSGGITKYHAYKLHMSQFVAHLGVQVRHATTATRIIRLRVTTSSEDFQSHENAACTTRLQRTIDVLLHTAIPLVRLNVRVSNRLTHSWYTVYKTYENPEWGLSGVTIN